MLTGRVDEVCSYGFKPDSFCTLYDIVFVRTYVFYVLVRLSDAIKR